MATEMTQMTPADSEGIPSSTIAGRLADAQSPAEAARATLALLVDQAPGRSGWLLLHDEVVARAGPRADGPAPRAAAVDLGSGWSLAVDGPEDRVGAHDTAILAAARTAVALLVRQTEMTAHAVVVERDRRQFELLLEVQHLVARRTPRAAVLEAICRGAAELLHSENASIHMRREDDPELLDMVGAVGPIVAEAETFRGRPIDEGMSGRVVRDDTVLSTHRYDAQGEALASMVALGVTSALGVPVHIDDVAVASLVVSTSAMVRYSEEDHRTLEAFAAHAELAIADAIMLAQHEEALHDPLTGLPQRRLLLDRLEQALHRREREGGDVAVLLLDLDRFKPINDTMGHHAGDEALRAVAARISNVLRSTDTAARIGGDEFAVVLPGADLDAAHAVAARMAATIDGPCTIHGRTVPLGASIGIAMASRVGDDGDDLLRAADVAMYEAKRRPGSVAVEHRPAMSDRVAARFELDADVRSALDDDELRLVYQPIVGVDGRVLAMEALLRWDHPTRGAIPPVDLVRRAETTGDIVRIGEWVLWTACEQLWRWQREVEQDIAVAVNVSRRQLETGTFPADVARVLRQTRVAPDRLILEVTESVLAIDAPEVDRALRELRELGVQVAVDDFGTGASSLGLLGSTTVDVLKLDRSLLPPTATDERSWAVVEVAALLASRLGLQLVVEGVECAAQLDRLRRLGCRTVQGFHVARPLEVDDATSWLADGRWSPSDGR